MSEPTLSRASPEKSFAPRDRFEGPRSMKYAPRGLMRPLCEWQRSKARYFLSASAQDGKVTTMLVN